MGSRSRGYSTLFIRKVGEADQSDLVIQFANACIEREIPILEIAYRMSVTRATVYNWFTGKSSPALTNKKKSARL